MWRSGGGGGAPADLNLTRRRRRSWHDLPAGRPAGPRVGVDRGKRELFSPGWQRSPLAARCSAAGTRIQNGVPTGQYRGRHQKMAPAGRVKYAALRHSASAAGPSSMPSDNGRKIHGTIVLRISMENCADVITYKLVLYTGLHVLLNVDMRRLVA